MTSIYGTGFAHVGEGHYVLGPARAWWDSMPPTPLAFYLHGGTSSAAMNAADPNEMGVIRRLSARFLVVVSDWGGPLTFANDTSIARVGEGITAARAALNVDPEAPVVMVGMSMGAGGALAYALANPTEVAAVAGMIPMLDIEDIVTNDRLGLGSEVNDAYGGAYSDVTHGPTHSPVIFADDLDPDLPVHLWTSTNDTATPPATATEFVDAREQTTRTSLGAVGHSTASITGAQAAIADWCIANAP